MLLGLENLESLRYLCESRWDAASLRQHDFDRAALAERRLNLERLDQLTVELLLGAR